MRAQLPPRLSFPPQDGHRAGKSGRARLVPLHPSAVPPLRDYAADRERRFGPPAGSEAFFRTDHSTRVSYNAASSTFIVLRGQLGWTGSVSCPAAGPWPMCIAGRIERHGQSRGGALLSRNSRTVSLNTAGWPLLTK